MGPSDLTDEGRALLLSNELALSILEMSRSIPMTSETYKNLKPSEKTRVDEELKSICAGFLQSTMYKSGDTSKQLYKVCCEMAGYCSFMKQPLFYILLVVVGALFLNLISIGLVCFICRKKNKGVSRPAGGHENNDN